MISIRPLAAVFAALLTIGCGGTSPLPGSPNIPTPASLPNRTTLEPSNGIATWTSITTSRQLCDQITGQVGQSWPIWVTSNMNSWPSFTITISEGPPAGPADPNAEAPAIFVGTLANGDEFTAIRRNPNGGLACPGDPTITPLVGGTLTALMDISPSGYRIVGDYTEEFGSGPAAVTLSFHFSASDEQ